jgi:hypothetical protein
MKKIFLTLIILAVLFILLVASYFLFFVKDESRVAEVVQENFVVENEEMKLNEKEISNNNTEANLAKPNLPQEPEKEIVSSGNFNKIDALHYGSGQVLVEKFGENYKLKFQNNFSSADGPDLFVYLSQSQDFKNRAIGGLDTKKTLNIGVLKNLKGEQEYIVSKNDFEKYNGAVVIWCKQFGIQFSRADLK